MSEALPVYLTQLIYLKPGQEEIFEQFEQYALAMLGDHQGQLLVRVRTRDNRNEGSLESPDEIHLVSFPSRDHYHAFIQDERRQQILHLKEASVLRMLLIEGIHPW